MRNPNNRTTPGGRPQFSIVIPARDEEQFLDACLDSITRAAKHAGTSIEVIVVLNRCTDNTEEMACKRGCVTVEDNSKNLSSIRNTGARQARGEFLVTIDADSRMSENMLSEIRTALNSSYCIGGGVVLVPERWSAGIALSILLLVPIALWHGISGGLFFCRRDDFWAIDGFDQSLSSAEDIDFARRLKALGKTRTQRFVTLWKTRLITSCRKFDRLGDWYFVLRPWMVLRLLQGRNQAAADKIWYDFPRDR